MEQRSVPTVTDDLLEERIPITSLKTDKTALVSWADTMRQIAAGCVSFFIVIQVGANMSYSTILLPQLAEKGSPIQVTESDASWIASIVAASLPLGALTIGILMDAFGRKKMCVLISLPFAISWLFQIYATEVWHMYMARIIAGFTGGLTTVAILYVSEISHPSLRQALLSLNSVFISIGILLTYFFGTLFRWRTTAIVMCCSALASGLAVTFLPESPYWYMIFRNDLDSANRSFRRLYKCPEVCELQYQHLLTIKTLKRNIYKEDQSRFEQFKSKFKIFKERAVYKPTIVLILIFLAQQMTGSYVVLFYATDIFLKLGIRQDQHEVMSDFTSLVLLGIVRFVSSVISVLVSKTFGRRTILIVSGVGMAFCSFFAGVYIYFSLLSHEQIEAMQIAASEKTYLIAFIFVLGYVAFGSLGFLVIPWTLIGELLPVKARGVIGGSLISFAYILMFSCVKIFPAILNSIDMHCILCVVSLFNLISVMFIYFFLPETLGKNFSEIERYFEK